MKSTRTSAATSGNARAHRFAPWGALQPAYRPFCGCVRRTPFPSALGDTALCALLCPQGPPEAPLGLELADGGHVCADVFRARPASSFPCCQPPGLLIRHARAHQPVSPSCRQHMGCPRPGSHDTPLGGYGGPETVVTRLDVRMCCRVRVRFTPRCLGLSDGGEGVHPQVP